MAGAKHGREFALTMLKSLPRVCLANLRPDPGTFKKPKTRRGQHGGDKCGGGNSGQRMNHMRPGYETGNTPFYQRFGYEPYYKGHHLRRQYPPLTMHQLQMLIDTNRLRSDKPIDLNALMNTGIYMFYPDQKHCGVHLTDEGAEIFKAKVNIEVQWATEPVIAAIERNGGTITTAYYDMHSLNCLKDAEQFFRKGVAIPRRLLPPIDCLEFYSNPATRGYLADPEKVSYERLVLSQKYGYVLPKIEDDPNYDMLVKRKDPRQIFYGLEPGWVVNIPDKVILKPKEDYLKEFYAS